MTEQTRAETTEASQEAAGSGIGALLRASRLRVGEELQEVAEMLRIRHKYLQSIEDGRFEDLPGTTYAVGFVRAYADHLGLDAEEVVRRFKQETAGSGGGTNLRFPVPVHESGLPTGAIVFVGLIIAVVAYAGWYVSTSDNKPFATEVSPVPERMAEATDTAQPPAEPAAEAEAKAEGDAATDTDTSYKPPVPVAAESTGEAVQEATEKVAEQSAPIAAQATTQEAAQETAQAVTPSVEAGATPAATPETVQQAAQATASQTGTEAARVVEEAPASTPNLRTEPAQPVTAAPSPAPKPVAEPAPQPAAQTEPAAVASQPALVLAPAEPVVEAAAGTPADDPDVTPVPEVASAPSEAASDANIVIRATSNSWIQIRDENAQQLIMTRLLRAGDSYEVPKQGGLKLLTGNAGALEILVNGEAVPAIGAEGDVRRGVWLDAERLKLGTAVEE